jgi:hypothetical protein
MSNFGSCLQENWCSKRLYMLSWFKKTDAPKYIKHIQKITSELVVVIIWNVVLGKVEKWLFKGEDGPTAPPPRERVIMLGLWPEGHPSYGLDVWFGRQSRPIDGVYCTSAYPGSYNFNVSALLPRLWFGCPPPAPDYGLDASPSPQDYGLDVTPPPFPKRQIRLMISGGMDSLFSLHNGTFCELCVPAELFKLGALTRTFLRQSTHGLLQPFLFLFLFPLLLRNVPLSEHVPVTVPIPLTDTVLVKRTVPVLAPLF